MCKKRHATLRGHPGPPPDATPTPCQPVGPELLASNVGVAACNLMRLRGGHSLCVAIIARDAAYALQPGLTGRARHATLRPAGLRRKAFCSEFGTGNHKLFAG